MPNKYDELANDAAKMSDKEFRDKLSGLTTLTNTDIESIITQTGISQQDLVAVLQEVHTATTVNEATANNISAINKGVTVLAAIVKKFI